MEPLKVEFDWGVSSIRSFLYKLSESIHPASTHRAPGPEFLQCSLLACMGPWVRKTLHASLSGSNFLSILNQFDFNGIGRASDT